MLVLPEKSQHDAVVSLFVWDDETDKLLIKLWDVHVEVLVVVLHDAVECEVGIVFRTAERIGTEERDVPQPPLYGCVKPYWFRRAGLQTLALHCCLPWPRGSPWQPRC